MNTQFPLFPNQSSSIVSIAFNALPVLGFAEYQSVWCPDHPQGAGIYNWNGLAWIGTRPIASVSPNATTILSAIGLNPSVAGVSHPAISTASKSSSLRRFLFSSTATAGTVGFVRSANMLCFPGGVSSIGGYYFNTVLTLETLRAENRGFLGMATLSGAPTNLNWLTGSSFGKIGVAFDADTGNLKIVHNIQGTAPIVINLGSDFPLANNEHYRLELGSAPLSSSLSTRYKVTNQATGAVATGIITTNQPTVNTGLSPLMAATNNATAAIASLGSTGWDLFALS